MASPVEFEEYRRADIRFHIGIAEAAALSPVGDGDDGGAVADE